MAISGNFFAGVDVGSLAAKSVILKDREIFTTWLLKSGVNSVESGLSALNLALDAAVIARSFAKKEGLWA